MWLNLAYGYLHTQIPLCWEQKNPLKQNHPSCTRNMGRVSVELCIHSVTLKKSCWFDADWLCNPGTYWVLPWYLVFCGTNLWPWLPPGGLAFVPGFENLGFHWGKGGIWPMQTEIGNLLLLSVRLANSVLHWCHHLATFVFSSMGLEDVIAHSSVQFSCSVMLTLWDPMDCSTQGFPSITNSWSLLKLMSIKLVMPSSHVIFCHHLFLLPSIFPSIRVFSSESVLCIR